MVKKTTVQKGTALFASSSARRAASTTDDVKTALLIVSAAINVAVLVAWLAIKLTSKYDEQVAAFLFG